MSHVQKGQWILPLLLFSNKNTHSRRLPTLCFLASPFHRRSLGVCKSLQRTLASTITFCRSQFLQAHPMVAGQVLQGVLHPGGLASRATTAKAPISPHAPLGLRVERKNISQCRSNNQTFQSVSPCRDRQKSPAKPFKGCGARLVVTVSSVQHL